MGMLRIMAVLLIVGIFSGRASATAPGTWSPPATISTLLTDDCVGNSVTAVYLTDGTGPYYFLNSSSSAKFWTSQLEMAQSTGQKAKIKYEQTNSNPGANCGFNPGNVIYAISVGP